MAQVTDNTKGIIFDMDGTLVDNMPYHNQAWLEFLRGNGLELTDEEFLEKHQGTLLEMMRKFFGEEKTEEELIKLGQLKEQRYRELYAEHILEIIGLTEFLRSLKKRGIKVALATMGDQLNIDFTLDALGIRGYFDVLVGGHQIKNGKPHPEIFATAVKLLGLEPHECIAIEDSPGGIKSALEAGLAVIGLSTSHSREELIGFGCYATISNFVQLSLN